MVYEHFYASEFCINGKIEMFIGHKQGKPQCYRLLSFFASKILRLAFADNQHFQISNSFAHSYLNERR